MALRVSRASSWRAGISQDPRLEFQDPRRPKPSVVYRLPPFEASRLGDGGAGWGSWGGPGASAGALSVQNWSLWGYLQFLVCRPDDPPSHRRGADRRLDRAGRGYDGELRNRAENSGWIFEHALSAEDGRSDCRPIEARRAWAVHDETVPPQSRGKWARIALGDYKFAYVSTRYLRLGACEGEQMNTRLTRTGR